MEKMCGPAMAGVGGSGASLGGDGEDFHVAGDDLAVTLQLPMVCPQDVEVRATVTVQDPNNLPLALSEGDATRVVTERDELGMKTTIKVHGALPGAYHFTAHFEPNLGQVQSDLLLAENLRDAGAELVVANGDALTSCSHLDVTPSGRLLCLSGAVRVFERDGTLLQTLTPSGLSARVGALLWVLADGGMLTRWLETDAGFAAQDPAGLQLQIANPILAADEADLFLAGQFGQLRSVRADAGLMDLQHIDTTTNQPIAIWKSGADYVVVGAQGLPSNTLVEVCTGTLDIGSTCQRFFGVVDGPSPFGTIGTEAAGIWSVNRSQVIPAPRLLTLTKAHSTRELALPGSWTSADAGFVAWDTGAQLINSQGEHMLVLDRAGTFVLQKYAELPVQSVTSRWLVLKTAGGSLSFFRR
jgi:hypothetical protein